MCLASFVNPASDLEAELPGLRQAPGLLELLPSTQGSAAFDLMGPPSLCFTGSHKFVVGPMNIRIFASDKVLMLR